MSLLYTELPKSTPLAIVPATTNALTPVVSPVFLKYEMSSIAHFAVVRRKGMPEGRLFTERFYPMTSPLQPAVIGVHNFVRELVRARTMVPRPKNYELPGNVFGWDLRIATLPDGVGIIAMAVWLP